MEALGQESYVSVTLPFRHLVYTMTGISKNRRLSLVKVGFGPWNLAISGHVPLPEEEQQLTLGEFWIDFCQGEHLEGQVTS